MNAAKAGPSARWLNRTVLGIGLASLFSDLSHEVATTVMPAFLATLGAAPLWLGLIEGVADGVSSFVKLGSGYFTDRLARRKPIAVAGYLVTALGTASLGLATMAWHVLVARSVAWLGRGIRTPVRKALLAAAVTPETRGRAFGFERMLDTLGAIIGPALALWLLPRIHHHYPTLFALTLVPGLLATLVIVWGVRERACLPVKHLTFFASLRGLPRDFRRYLAAVGLFGLGDFAHTLLILFAIQQLTPSLGAAGAASMAIGLYILRNVANAACSPLAGWLADRLDKRWVLAGGYLFAALMGVALLTLPLNGWTFGGIFFVAGVYAAVQETVEDVLAAAYVGEAQHGMAFGALATVNGLGDLLSSVIVGALWTAWSATGAFGYSTLLFLAGAVGVLCLPKIRPLEPVV